MSILTVDMPEELRHWIDRQIEGGRYVDAGDYLRHLVRRDSLGTDARTAWLREMVAQADASGIIEEEPEDIIERLIAEIPARDD